MSKSAAATPVQARCEMSLLGRLRGKLARVAAPVKGIIERLAAKTRLGGRCVKDGALDLKDRLGMLRDRLPSLWVIKGRLAGRSSGKSWRGQGQAASQRGDGEVAAPGPIAERGPAPLKKWTVFVYVNADNDLHANGVFDVREMRDIGSSDDVNVVVLFDGNKAENLKQGKTELLLVEKGKTRVLKRLGEANMSDPNFLQQNVIEVMNQFPAEKTAVIVWGHGTGWKSVSPDDDPESEMAVPSFGMALANIKRATGRKLEVLGFDACLMNMAEVNREVCQSAKYCVASEATIPKNGWDYRAVLGALTQNPNMDGRGFAKTIVDSYGRAYNGGSQGREEVCLSAIDLANYERSSRLIDDFARSLQGGSQGMDRDLVSAAADQACHFNDDRDAIDLLSFAGHVAKNSRNEETKRCAQRLCDFMASDVIIDNTVVGNQYAGARGMSIFFPGESKQYNDWRDYYGTLSMSRTAGWKQMLDTYFKN